MRVVIHRGSKVFSRRLVIPQHLVRGGTFKQKLVPVLL